MRVLPVLDLLRGQVVRGIAGRRSEYRPITSRLVADSAPQAVGRALRELGFAELYVADLDAIQGGASQAEHYRLLCDLGCRLWIDAGLRDGQQAESFVSALEELPDTPDVIAGLESLANPAMLVEILRIVGPERLIFSLDLKDGSPLTGGDGWAGQTPCTIATTTLAIGLRRFIVLDLAQVGVGAGVSTLSLCRWLRRQTADVEVTTGGGVRDMDDLTAMEQAGCDAALVASALHDGRIEAEQLRELGWL